MTNDEIDLIVEGMVPALKLHVGKVVAAEGKALEARVAQLEARPRGMEYRGVHDSAKAYEQNDCVTYGGHLWIALRDTAESPGFVQKSADWKLAVKAGRDGKDCQCEKGKL